MGIFIFCVGPMPLNNFFFFFFNPKNFLCGGFGVGHGHPLSPPPQTRLCMYATS
jgi:hypothetical protein